MGFSILGFGPGRAGGPNEEDTFRATCGTPLTLASCATPPDRIAGVPNAGKCTQTDRQRLAILSNKQEKAATGDALGVFLIGVPVASLSGGDNETEIAILKGRCGDPYGRPAARGKQIYIQ
jgi:hypothetical protein